MDWEQVEQHYTALCDHLCDKIDHALAAEVDDTGHRRPARPSTRLLLESERLLSDSLAKLAEARTLRKEGR